MEPHQHERLVRRHAEELNQPDRLHTISLAIDHKLILRLDLSLR